jgi:membrane protease YdiL (CAAX protease family)
MTGKLEGWAGIKSLLKSGFKMRISPAWWLIILILPAVLSGLTLWANVSLNNFQFDKSLLIQPYMIPIMYLMMFFIGGSFQEEFGWRGYALPRLLEKWNPLNASLILGAIWGIWHLPLFFIPDTGQYFMPLGIFLILVEAFTVLITWAFLRTGRNLFSALLFHTSINTMLSVFPPIEKIVGGNQMGFTYLTIAYVVTALVIIFKERALLFDIGHGA